MPSTKPNGSSLDEKFPIANQISFTFMPTEKALEKVIGSDIEL